MTPLILIIEDNSERMAWTVNHLATEGVRSICARSAGVALGILQRDGRRSIDGIMLDHDLQEAPLTEADLRLSGSSLVSEISKLVPRWVPILIHSMNGVRAATMARRLGSSGFAVTQCPMAELTAERLSAWVAEVRDDWDD